MPITRSYDALKLSTLHPKEGLGGGAPVGLRRCFSGALGAPLKIVGAPTNDLQVRKNTPKGALSALFFSVSL